MLFSSSRQRRFRQNAEAEFWNGSILEFADGVARKALELISEKIWHLRRKKQTGLSSSLMIEGFV
jgi:hypothetical protein